MNSKLLAKFNDLAKNGLISGVDVESVAKSYGFPFSRRTLQKWATLRVIPPPAELNDCIGNGRRTGYSYDALVKILALNLTLRAITGLGKGSRIKKRFTVLSAAIRFAEEERHDLSAMAGASSLAYLKLAAQVVSTSHERGISVRYAKLIRLVAIVYCFAHNLILCGEDFDVKKGVKILTKASVFESTQDSIGINESRLRLVPTNAEVLYGLDQLTANVELIAKSKFSTDFKAWAKAVRFFDSNGWVADLGTIALKRQGYDSFVKNAKANWLVAVAIDV